MPPKHTMPPTAGTVENRRLRRTVAQFFASRLTPVANLSGQPFQLAMMSTAQVHSPFGKPFGDGVAAWMEAPQNSRDSATMALRKSLLCHICISFRLMG